MSAHKKSGGHEEVDLKIKDGSLPVNEELEKPRMRFKIVKSAVAFMLAFSCAVCLAQKPVSIPEKIEWTWEVRPPSPDDKLPNVLLLGDSITRNYFPQVTKDLAGIANVYLMSSSTSVGDPRLPHQIEEFAAMENVHFRLIHFNNGMHGWAYSEPQYKAAFPRFLHAVRKLTGGKRSLIWASTTPVRKDTPEEATNARVDDRNAIALSLVQEAGIVLDDQHALMAKHRELYDDDVHFNPEGANLQGDQAAALIREVLGK